MNRKTWDDESGQDIRENVRERDKRRTMERRGKRQTKMAERDERDGDERESV